jgi:DNA-binding transcriptional LysR family regulator
MAQVVLAPVLREFRESYPLVSVVVSLEDSPKAIREVEAGTTDLALVVEHKPPASLKGLPALPRSFISHLFATAPMGGKARDLHGGLEESTLSAVPAPEHDIPKSGGILPSERRGPWLRMSRFQASKL